MKVRWLGVTHFLGLTYGKMYEVLSVEKGWYRIVDNTGEDYLYPPNNFEIVEGNLTDSLTGILKEDDDLNKVKEESLKKKI